MTGDNAINVPRDLESFGGFEPTAIDRFQGKKITFIFINSARSRQIKITYLFKKYN